MINPQELRFGNWINEQGLELQVGMITQNLFLNSEPIPITEKCLKEFGWKYYNGKRSGDLTKDTHCKLDIDFIKGKLMVKSHYEGESFYRDLRIDYVHQLQNLMYAFGEELIKKK